MNWILLGALWLSSSVVGAVTIPDELADTCLKGGMASAVCDSMPNCPPCWQIAGHGKYNCYDLQSDGKCPFGDKSVDVTAKLEKWKGGNQPRPTPGPDGGDSGGRKYRSTTTTTVTVTVSYAGASSPPAPLAWWFGVTTTGLLLLT